MKDILQIVKVVTTNTGLHVVFVRTDAKLWVSMNALAWDIVGNILLERAEALNKPVSYYPKPSTLEDYSGAPLLEALDAGIVAMFDAQVWSQPELIGIIARVTKQIHTVRPDRWQLARRFWRMFLSTFSYGYSVSDIADT